MPVFLHKPTSSDSLLTGACRLAWPCAAAGVCLLVSAATAQPNQGPPAEGENPVRQIKKQFTEAMQHPLAERVLALKQVRQQMNQALEGQALSPKQRVATLQMQYRLEKAVARYSNAKDVFGQYAQALKDWGPPNRARRILIERVKHVHESRAFNQSIAAADAALAHWAEDSKAAAALRYYKAQSLREVPGRADEALPILETIVQEHMESPFRPKAMRDLGVLQASGLKDAGSAIDTFKLMQQQYRDTRWEQLAHLMPAVIWEVRHGKPQKALERYRATLEQFPDHKYAVFCRAQIRRLQDVIEQQLIDDALKDVRRDDSRRDHGTRLPAGPSRIAMRGKEALAMQEQVEELVQSSK